MKVFKISILLGLVFFAGVMVGAGGAHFAVRKVVEQASKKPELVRARLEMDFGRQLKLTAGQRPKVHEIMVRRFDDIQQLRSEFQPKLGLILTRSEQELREVLDERQRVKLDSMIKKRPLQTPVPRPEL